VSCSCAILDMSQTTHDRFLPRFPHVNARGQVVGTSGDCAGTFEIHGFLSEKGGPMIDLNDFVPPGSELTVTDGETINDGGEIAGTGMLPNGDFHAIVLIPCDAEHGRH